MEKPLTLPDRETDTMFFLNMMGEEWAVPESLGETEGPWTCFQVLLQFLGLGYG